jgi:hypothetical protein
MALWWGCLHTIDSIFPDRRDRKQASTDMSIGKMMFENTGLAVANANIARRNDVAKPVQRLNRKDL